MLDPDDPNHLRHIPADALLAIAEALAQQRAIGTSASKIPEPIDDDDQDVGHLDPETDYGGMHPNALRIGD